MINKDYAECVNIVKESIDELKQHIDSHIKYVAKHRNSKRYVKDMYTVAYSLFDLNNFLDNQALDREYNV